MAKPQLPLKTLTVRSGLAHYGRNNICYVPGKEDVRSFAGIGKSKGVELLEKGGVCLRKSTGPSPS